MPLPLSSAYNPSRAHGLSPFNHFPEKNTPCVLTAVVVVAVAVRRRVRAHLDDVHRVAAFGGALVLVLIHGWLRRRHDDGALLVVLCCGVGLGGGSGAVLALAELGGEEVEDEGGEGGGHGDEAGEGEATPGEAEEAGVSECGLGVVEHVDEARGEDGACGEGLGEGEEAALRAQEAPPLPPRPQRDRHTHHPRHQDRRHRRQLQPQRRRIVAAPLLLLRRAAAASRPWSGRRRASFSPVGSPSHLRECVRALGRRRLDRTYESWEGRCRRRPYPLGTAISSSHALLWSPFSGIGAPSVERGQGHLLVLDFGREFMYLTTNFLLFGGSAYV
uniref:Uncharacterized protein n=1 Tax=Ananas comosus var. bracteatus TaxID=296719 RepID=A0A6V7NPE7_ANACO|nr:unnamed protein product [Ananas comosus var. bracteatus]